MEEETAIEISVPPPTEIMIFLLVIFLKHFLGADQREKVMAMKRRM
jgi:hypothetical protein